MLPDNPHKEILDRQESANIINEHFNETRSLLREIIDYGTNLIIRCYETSTSKDLTDAVLLGTLLKHTVAMLDSIEILAAKGALLGANLPARSLFETWLYIQWIIMDDTDNRAKHYYVWHLRQDLLWTKRGDEGSEESEAFASAMGDFSESFKYEDIDKKQAIKDQIDSIEKILDDDQFKTINDKFESMKKPWGDVSWFEPCGLGSIYQIAKEVDCIAHYKVFYSYYSDIMHASVYKQNINIDGTDLTFVPIRQLKGIKSFLMHVITCSLSICLIILNRYRPTESENFSRKYAVEWRSLFFSIKDVEYNIQDELI